MQRLTDTQLIAQAIACIALACVGTDLIDALTVATAGRIQLAFVDVLNEDHVTTDLIRDAYPLTFAGEISDGLVSCNARSIARIRTIRCSLIGSRQ